jgi:hypothetical protein
MNIINFIKSIFGIKPKEKQPTFYKQSEELHQQAVVNELNQVTLKIGSDVITKTDEPIKPKKKRYRKKKTDNKVEAPKEVVTPKTTKDGTKPKPKTSKPKTPKQNPSV